MNAYANIFKSRYPVLVGRDWIRRIDQEDLKAFIRMGQQAHNYGRMGGLARAARAKRDHRGRFAKAQ